MTRRRRPRGSAVVALAVLAGLAAGCGSTHRPVGTPPTTSPAPTPPAPTSPSTTSPGTTTSTDTSQPAPSTTSFRLYFLRGNYLGVAGRHVPFTASVGTAAVDALLAGPSPSERAAGLSSAAPAGSRLLGLTVLSGVATANFNSAYDTSGSPSSELQRVAQVVFTLTQFPTVKTVTFRINGTTVEKFASGAVDLSRSVGRNDVLGAVPAILVETPAVGDALHGSLRMSGAANVYEAQFRVQLSDAAGTVLVDQPVHATAGSGTWGTFDATFRFTTTSTTLGTLRVYAVSMKDGSPLDEVDLRLPTGP